MFRYVCFIILFLSTSLSSQPKEYIFKSIFLAKFSKFIEWPPSHTDQNNFIVGIYGKGSYKSIIEKVYKTKKIKNKKVVIKYLDTPSQIVGCQMVIINQANDSELKSILKLAQHHSILTIGNSLNFVEQGAILGFYIAENNTIKFSLNQQSMKNSKLSIHFMLVEIANALEKEDSK